MRQASSAAAEESPFADYFSVTNLTVAVIVGLVFFIVHFPNLINTQIAPSIGVDALRNALTGFVALVQSGITQLVGQPAVSFKFMMSVNFLSFFIYVFLIVVWSASRLKPQPLLTTVIGLAVGLYVVHLLSWLIVASIWFAGFAYFILSTIYAAVAWFVLFIFTDALAFTIFAAIMLFLWVFRANLLRAVLTLALFAAVGAAAYYGLPHVFAFLLSMLNDAWAFLIELLRPVIEFFNWILSPFVWLAQLLITYVIAPLVALLVTLAVLLLAIAVPLLIATVVLALMGNVITDQFRAAFRVRHGGKNFLLNGFALGSALALVTLASVASPAVSAGIAEGWQDSLHVASRLTTLGVDQSWLTSVDFTKLFVGTMPGTVYEFVEKNLINVPPPIIDAALLFVLLVTSSTCTALGIVSKDSNMRAGRPITFISLEVVAIVVILLAAILILFAQAATEGGD
jgi:hypothetical protein